MKQVLIIPDRNNLSDCLKLAGEYKLGFEYNDFFVPDVLDCEDKTNEIIGIYEKQKLPVAYTTFHGAFYDVNPVSADSKIKAVSELRVEQSIGIARRMGASAVVFHTGYNPFLNSEGYVNGWVAAGVAYWSSVLERNPGINIYLENTFDTTPDVLTRLSERLHGYDNYGVCFDYAHASISQVKPEIWAERLAQYIKHVHINDNNGISDLHLAWGDGCINRDVFYKCYEKYMNNASVLIETSLHEAKLRSLEVLKKDGFLDN